LAPPQRCALHPDAPLRRFRADGPRGRAVYLFCVGGGRLHPVGSEPIADAPDVGVPEPPPQRPPERGPSDFSLTPSERDVLSLAALGLTVPETAERLMKGAETVRSQRNRVILKLGARNMTHAACRAVAHGVVKVDGQ
jgi:DNA-binding CsgD family transcriptional regulator